jgi:hypothetical protein
MAGALMFAAVALAGASALGAGSCTVTGAGTTDVNGAYVQSGTLNDKPYFDGGYSASGGGNRAIFYGKGRWTLAYRDGGMIVGGVLYAAEGGDCPPAQGWETYSGLDPAPSLTAIHCGDAEDEPEQGVTTLSLICELEAPLSFEAEGPVLRVVNLFHWGFYRVEIVDGPLHGAVIGDLDGFRLEQSSGEPIWIVPLTYWPAIGYSGADSFTVSFIDSFFSDASSVRVRIWVSEVGDGQVLSIAHGEGITVIPPVGFSYRQTAEDVTITDADGTAAEGAVRATWSSRLGRTVLALETAALLPGEYTVTMPLGNGQSVRLILDVR